MEVERKDNVLAIEESFVYYDPEPFVYVLSSNPKDVKHQKWEKQYVKTGLSDGINIEISGKITKDTIEKTLKGVITNPIILGIVFGLIRSLIPVKILLPTTIDYIAALATPLGLLALGASFDISAALDRSHPAILATILKLIVHPLYILPLSIYLGYGTDKLVALLIMAGSPTTVSCYVMAKSMGHPGVVSASTVMLTTFFSAFSLTLCLYILRTLGLI